jgi:hypothetical protein
VDVALGEQKWNRKPLAAALNWGIVYHRRGLTRHRSQGRSIHERCLSEISAVRVFLVLYL